MIELNKYLEKNYYELKQVVFNITKNDELTEELFHFCLMILYNYEEEKINTMIFNKHLKFFFVTIILNQFRSSTSPFFKTYKSAKISYTDQLKDITDSEGYDHSIDEQYEAVMTELSEEHWYTQEIVKMKGSGMSYQEIKNLTGIPRTSLYNTFNKFRNKIKK
jgi:DNA-directed RNA polymerase specialized sigma24 family protein